METYVEESVRALALNRLIRLGVPTVPQGGEEVIKRAHEGLPAVVTWTEALREVHRIRHEYLSTEGDSLYFFAQLESLGTTALEMLCVEREADFLRNDVLDEVLWAELLTWDLARTAFDLEAASGVITAERILRSRLGETTYQDQLSERRRRSTVSLRTISRIWRAKDPAAETAIFCTHCFTPLGSSLEEAAEKCGAEVGAFGTWGECFACGSPTVLRG